MAVDGCPVDSGDSDAMFQDARESMERDRDNMSDHTPASPTQSSTPRTSGSNRMAFGESELSSELFRFRKQTDLQGLSNLQKGRRKQVAEDHESSVSVLYNKQWTRADFRKVTPKRVFVEIDKSSELRARLAGQEERWKRKLQNALAAQQQEYTEALQAQQQKFTELFSITVTEATAKIARQEEALRTERLAYEQRYREDREAENRRYNEERAADAKRLTDQLNTYKES